METNDAANKLLAETEKKEILLHERLNQPLTFFQKTLVDALYALYFDVLGKKPRIDEDAAHHARKTFKKYFPEKLETMTEQLLSDPEAYKQKTDEFEKTCPPVFVDFPTDPSYYRVITSDPSRKLQEVLTRLAFLSNCNSSEKPYYALDMGTGYGRMARIIEDAAKKVFGNKRKYKIFGMDILESNIESAKKLNTELGSRVIFFTRDMNQIPFPSDTLSLVNTTDASYLNFRHRRPFYLAEIARVLSSRDGVCCITNPNENTTLKEYNYVMMRTNYQAYLNPVNIIKATVLGKCSLHIDALSKARPDWELTCTEDMTNSLTRALKTEIIRIDNWPKKGGLPIYSGFTFRVTKSTKKAIEKYTLFRESKKAEDEWFDI